MVAPRSCRASKDDGSSCQAPPLRDGLYCRLHDPEIADAVQDARRLGGLRRRKETAVAVAYDFQGLETVQQIRRLVEVAAYDVLGLDNTIARARTLAYLAQIAMGLVEKGEMEERMLAVEAALGPRLTAGRSRR
jgi:hypothetical protein